ncbi:me53 [Lambdina fiscellaria nucleopolyhedrovirus]|uniref:Me53 n=1 Tax=Lambdina fiscellaria nucleopolyhedrovirus TaxID=1642929 RepID=A0A0E3Z645_9ABAC|nr:me53 [Lambdina fiscellaria nucleopolyhedrovirus]AKC91748.1 me53 [Lambdina fiscellaria nucleopolyhedrovirus]
MKRADNRRHRHANTGNGVEDATTKTTILPFVKNVDAAAAATPQDLRAYFLSDENVKLLKTVFEFFKDYAQGKYRVNNLASMNCKDVRRPEVIAQTACNQCKTPFDGAPFTKLVCVIDERVVDNNENADYTKHGIVCGSCGEKYGCKEITDNMGDNDSIRDRDNNSGDGDGVYHKRVYALPVFPRLTFATLEQLCRLGFVTKYLFLIDVDDYKIVRRIKEDDLRNVYFSFCKLIKEKAPYEQIVSVSMITYAQTLFTETSRGCCIELDEKGGGAKSVIGFDDARCQLTQFIKTHTFGGLYYFYEVTKRVYRNYSFDYVLYYAVSPIAHDDNDYRLDCSKCKTKIYKNNIILYCSKCGFMNRSQCIKQMNDVNRRRTCIDDLQNMKFFKECVKAHKTVANCILYYDMNVYNKMLASKK